MRIIISPLTRFPVVALLVCSSAFAQPPVVADNAAEKKGVAERLDAEIMKFESEATAYQESVKSVTGNLTAVKKSLASLKTRLNAQQKDDSSTAFLMAVVNDPSDDIFARKIALRTLLDSRFTGKTKKDVAAIIKTIGNSKSGLVRDALALLKKADELTTNADDLTKEDGTSSLPLATKRISAATKSVEKSRQQLIKVLSLNLNSIAGGFYFNEQFTALEAFTNAWSTKLRGLLDAGGHSHTKVTAALRDLESLIDDTPLEIGEPPASPPIPVLENDLKSSVGRLNDHVLLILASDRPNAARIAMQQEITVKVKKIVSVSGINMPKTVEETRTRLADFDDILELIKDKKTTIENHKAGDFNTKTGVFDAELKKVKQTIGTPLDDKLAMAFQVVESASEKFRESHTEKSAAAAKAAYDDFLKQLRIAREFVDLADDPDDPPSREGLASFGWNPTVPTELLVDAEALTAAAAMVDKPQENLLKNLTQGSTVELQLMAIEALVADNKFDLIVEHGLTSGNSQVRHASDVAVIANAKADIGDLKTLASNIDRSVTVRRGAVEAIVKRGLSGRGDSKKFAVYSTAIKSLQDVSKSVQIRSLRLQCLDGLRRLTAAIDVSAKTETAPTTDANKMTVAVKSTTTTPAPVSVATSTTSTSSAGVEKTETATVNAGSKDEVTLLGKTTKTDLELGLEQKAQISGADLVKKTETGAIVLLVSDVGYVLNVDVQVGSELKIKQIGPVLSPEDFDGMEAITNLKGGDLLIAFEDNNGTSHRVESLVATVDNDTVTELTSMKSGIANRLTQKAIGWRPNYGPECLTQLDEGKSAIMIAEMHPDEDIQEKWSPGWIVNDGDEAKDVKFERGFSPIRHEAGRFGKYSVKDATTLPNTGDLLILEYDGFGPPDNRQNATAVRRISKAMATYSNDGSSLEIRAPKPLYKEFGPEDPSKWNDAYEAIVTWPKNKTHAYVLIVADNGSGAKRPTKFMLFECPDQVGVSPQRTLQ